VLPPIGAEVPAARAAAERSAAVTAPARHSLARLAVAQMAQKQGPGDQGMIDVVDLTTEEGEYLPNCVDNQEATRKGYRRSGGIDKGWNDTDIFYADGAGPLVQITVKMVNDYWNPKYEGFDQESGPDWTVNCEDYAKAGGFGEEVGAYNSKETLSAKLTDNGNYVLQLSYHWMRVAKTGADAITIRQKDGESAVYKKDFNLDAALEYIMAKRGAGGTVFKG